MTLLRSTFYDMRSEFVAHFQEIYTLLPKVIRFTWLMITTILTIVLIPIYGALSLSLHLWGENEWSKKLTSRQKIIFWVTTILVSVAQWYTIVSLLINYGLLP